MDITKLLGQRIRELRKKKGLTQEQLAEKAGVDLKYIGSLERQERINPTIGTLEKLASALSVTPVQLLSVERGGPAIKRLRAQINQVLETCGENKLKLILRVVRDINEWDRE